MPEKKLYFHIGTHKTGTTYLQRWLQANSAPLKKSGICYAGRCTTDTGQYIAPDFETKVQRFLNDNSCQTLIVSDEDLSHNKDDIALNLIRGCAGKFEVKVVCYIREIVSFYISFYCYASVYLSNSNRAPRFLTLSDYVSAQNAYASTHDLLFRLVDSLGIESILVRPYGRRHFPDGAIEYDFLDVLGCKAAGLHSIEIANESPTLMQAEGIYYALQLTSDPPVRRILLAKVLNDKRLADRACTITRKGLDSIYDAYRQFELDIARKFFNTEETKGLFGKSYEDWASDIERNGAGCRLSTSDRQEVRDLLLIAQNEVLLEEIRASRGSTTGFGMPGRFIRAFGHMSRAGLAHSRAVIKGRVR